MPATIYSQLSSIRSRISFQPLVQLWREAAKEEGAAARICGNLLERFGAVPALLAPITDYSILAPHKVLIEEAMNTIFPAGFSKKEELYAVAMPFHSKVIYASSFFRDTYLDEQGNYKQALDPQVEKNVAVAKVNLAYKLILKKWYDIDLVGGNAFICSYPEREHNIHNYFELEWDPQFIDISTSMDLPALGEDFFFRCHQVGDLISFPQLAQLLPLDHFVFDGLVITRIREVSERETVGSIRSILQKEACFENKQYLRELQQQLRYLLRREEAHIGFTAFYETEEAVELPKVNFASVLLENIHQTADDVMLCHQMAAELRECPNFFWQWRSDDAGGSFRALEQRLIKDGWKSALLTALYHDDKVIGCVEILTRTGKPVNKKTLIRLEHARGVLQAALAQYRQQVLNRITALVKEHFTAVQSSVEWKFNNAAIHYLLQQHLGESPRMLPVVFEQVHPLYGVIDIKNSSGERNRAIQQDVLQQLTWAQKLLTSVQQQVFYPLIQEVLSRVDFFLSRISNYLFAADEQAVQQFLRTEVAEMLQYVRQEAPAFREQIEAYLAATDNPMQLLNENRRKFEESVTRINNTVIEYLEEEQERMQALYPHYFERFATDGVDFNIYVGQSVTPGRVFHAVHLKNLRLWQLQFLAKAARQVHHLGNSMPLPLQTTQLVLVYNEAIAIRFRNAERKFDVDGVHNARYEVVKKRIDKALIRGTNERLTQAGTIAIVYSHDEEAREYQQYIAYLKSQGLVTGDTEMLEVEDLQSVSGLKALRIAVLMDGAGQEVEQSTGAVSSEWRIGNRE